MYQIRTNKVREDLNWHNLEFKTQIPYHDDINWRFNFIKGGILGSFNGGDGCLGTKTGS